MLFQHHVSHFWRKKFPSSAVVHHQHGSFPPGSCYFSRLDGTTHINEHFGPTNGRIRLHLGLKIPDQQGTITYIPDQQGIIDEDSANARGASGQKIQAPQKCFLRVAENCYHWSEGEVLAFDDSYYHGVYLEALGESVGDKREKTKYNKYKRSLNRFSEKAQFANLERTDGLNPLNPEEKAFPSAAQEKGVLQQQQIERGIFVCDVYHPSLTGAEKTFLENMEQINAKYFPGLQNWTAVH